jgi:hypothetical protein
MTNTVNLAIRSGSGRDQVEIRKSRFEDIARSGFLDLKKSGDQEIRFSWFFEIREIRIKSGSGNQTSPANANGKTHGFHVQNSVDQKFLISHSSSIFHQLA